MGPFEKRAELPGSPAAVFRARIAAELAAGTIPCACPHPVTANQLSLPSRTLRCAECGPDPCAEPDSGPCASCGAADARNWLVWVDRASGAGVVARVCESCGTSGTAPAPGLN